MKWISLLIFLPLELVGQQMTDFWKPIEGLPNTTSIAYFTLVVDQEDRLYAGTDQGLFVTSDLGVSWTELFLTEIPVIQIATSNSDVYVVTADQKIHISTNKGQKWHTSSFDSGSQITDLIILPDESILLSTGHLEEKNGAGVFRGKGLYKSVDKGQSWQKLDLGYTKDHYISKLVQDSKGRIYAGLNEYSAKDGVILCSPDQGLTWEKVPVLTFDWSEGEEDDIGPTAIVQVASMGIDRRDNLVVSIQGANGTVATSINLKNSHAGAFSGTEWEHIRLVPFGYPWFYLEAHQLYFPSNGSAFAARIGQSFNLAGIFYLAGMSDKGFEKQQIAPVYFGDVPNFTKVTFAEASDRRIFAVQELDQSIYYTDLEKLPLTVGESAIITVYPNPFEDFIHVEIEEVQTNVTAKLMAMDGSVLHVYNATQTNSITLNPIVPPGVYILQTVIDGETQFTRMIKK